MSFMKKTLISAALLLPFTLQAEAVSDAEADYLAGSLCALSQRMAKDYIAVGADIRPDKAMKDLDESVAQFEQTMLTLSDYTAAHKLTKEMDALSVAWAKYRVDLLSTPAKDKAGPLLHEAEDVLKLCNKAVAAITQQSKSPYAKQIELSEDETTLAQKIARDYFALYWQVDNEEIRKDFQQSVAEFEKILAELKTSKKNSGEIQAALERVESQWKFSKSGFALDGSGHYVPTVIAVTTDSMYNKMSDIAELYEKQP